MKSIDPSYFKLFDQQAIDDDLEDETMPGQDSPAYLQALQAYLESGEARPEGRPEDKDRALLLVAQEQAAAAEITDLLPDVENMAWHLSLRRTIEKLWKESWYAPRMRTCYGLWDHMAPLSL